MNASSLERGKTEGVSTSNVKVFRLNNFTNPSKKPRIVASSHSPSGLGTTKEGNPVKKLKVGKSPYLNDCFKQKQS